MTRVVQGRRVGLMGNTKSPTLYVDRALIQLRGMEDGLRVILALFDNALTKRSIRPDDFYGIASLATYNCAFYCEAVLKTIIVGLTPDLITVLANVPPWHKKEKTLPRDLRIHDLGDLYDRADGLLPPSDKTLGEYAIEFARDGGANVPLEWIPNRVEEVFTTDASSFIEWRYGLAQGDDDIVGSPKSLFAVGKGLTLFADGLFESRFHTSVGRSFGTAAMPVRTAKRQPAQGDQ